jgi:hypothetical protein
MSTLVSVCQQIRIFKEGTTYARWQNYFGDEVVDGFEFQPFSVSTIQVNRSADEGGVVIEGPSTFRLLTQFETSVNDQHVIEVKLLQQTGSVTTPSFGSFQVIAMFTGVALTMTNNLTQARLSVGSAIDAVSGDAPGRKLTLAEIGELPKI